MTYEEFIRLFVDGLYHVKCDSLDQRNAIITLLEANGFTHNPLSDEYVRDHPEDTLYMHVGMQLYDDDDDRTPYFVLWNDYDAGAVIGYEDAVCALTQPDEADLPDDSFSDMLDAILLAVK